MSLLSAIKDIIDRINGEPDASKLESGIRLALVHYYLRISNQDVLDLTHAGEARLNLKTPVRFHGNGKISIYERVFFGAYLAPYNLSYSYIAARSAAARIDIHSDVTINNRACIVAESTSITIGEKTLIGPECVIGDSNAHELAVARRLEPDSDPRPVTIGRNVFIGNRVMIMKGVIIGDGCVIGAGTVVPPNFTAPPNKIIAGNPARIIRDVPE